MLLQTLRKQLTAEGLISEDKFTESLQIAKEKNLTIDKYLVTEGIVTERRMLKLFSDYLRLPLVEKFTSVSVPHVFTDNIPVQFARYRNIVAIGENNGTIRVATCSPLEIYALDEIARKLDKTLEIVLAPRAEIVALIGRAYSQNAGASSSGQSKLEVSVEIKEDEIQDFTQIEKEIEQSTDLLDMANKGPIVKMVNNLIFNALRMRASDIHIQPFEDRLVIRYRIDGMLYDMINPPKKLQEAIISRIKVMANMDIAERRLPQDGRCTTRLGDSDIDIRVSSVPTSHGERVCMRLLDKSARLYELEEIGLEVDQLTLISKFIHASHGIILVTGPTGSGKTTTLYASLKRINTGDMNIMTIEDPVEYHLPGSSQIEVNYKKGLTFASGLRSIVRQDPDIIMVGEIRDLETATIAVQSALTGHLVFSTLHTNDAPGAVTRLLNLGIEPYLVASSVIGVVAQRLVRKICDNCKAPYDPSVQEAEGIGLKLSDISGGVLYKGAGCARCLNSGYYDRTAIYEIFPLTEDIGDLVMSRANASKIKQKAVSQGMRTLRQDGAKKVIRGITTIQEVAFITQQETFEL
ncbi:MAG: type II secretion system ATPase GspE [Planctomycetes bacterium]|nr:type II secretion system ATPase GspE [Planctomycetota bacterium]